MGFNGLRHSEALLVGYILHWTLLNCYWSISEWIRSKSTVTLAVSSTPFIWFCGIGFDKISGFLDTK